MKKSVFIFSLIMWVLTFSNLNAQTADPATQANELTEKQKVQLSLTEDQYPKVEAINLEFFRTTQTIKNGDGSKAAKFKSLKKADETREQALKTVLTDEQFSAFKEQQKENRQEFKNKIKASRKN
jgi:hypothetical protein